MDEKKEKAVSFELQSKKTDSLVNTVLKQLWDKQACHCIR